MRNLEQKRKFRVTKEHNKQVVKAIIDTAKRVGETEFAALMEEKMF